MTLTDKQIAVFAEMAADADRKHAVAYYAQAQDDVRGNGYRVTQRVRDVLWRTLKAMEA